MKSFGQFCPLAQATQLLCERWTLLVVRELVAGSTRFNELRKGVPLMSPTLLSARLKQLVEAGVITRSGSKNKAVYTLTKAGRELTPIVQLLGAWGHRWVPTSLVVEDLDASLLMWDMRRSINRDAFPEDRIVVQVSEQGEIELCLNDPGIEVDVVIKSALRTMTAVWTCKIEFDDAVRQGEIEVFGDSALTKNLSEWLQSSALSQLGSLENPPNLDWTTA